MPDTELHERMLDMALRLARRGRPSPNPHVGAVVARGERVVGTGYHRRAGEAHAEIRALAQAGRKARGATLYVTLQPCNHQGRTGPCVDAILAARIARVVYGCTDPSGHARGSVRRLRAAGVEVIGGVRQAQAETLVADFAKHSTQGVPYVLLKAALTLDGRMAARSGDSKWITGERARTAAHRLRADCDAVLAGIGTVLADDPSLNVRWVRGRDPVRVVLDSRLRTPPTARVLTSSTTAPTWIIHGPQVRASARKRLASVPSVELLEVPGGPGGIDLQGALRTLAERGVVRLLVEGGSLVHGSMLREGWADEVALFMAPRILADQHAKPLAHAGPLARIAAGWHVDAPAIRRLGDDLLIRGKLTRQTPAPAKPRSGGKRGGG